MKKRLSKFLSISLATCIVVGGIGIYAEQTDNQLIIDQEILEEVDADEKEIEEKDKKDDEKLNIEESQEEEEEDKNGKIEEEPEIEVTAEDMPKLNKMEHIQYIQGYKDGTVRPRNHITREEVSAVFFRLLDPVYRESIRSDKIDQFSDMPDYKWSRKHVGTLTKGGIMKGYTNGMFKPEKTISRAELAAIVSRFDVLEEGDGGFIDVGDHWAKDQINSAAKKGWIEGYADGSFRPNVPITRAEFVTVVNHVLNRDVRIKNTLPEIDKYKDLEDYRWYYEAMIEALHSHDYKEERLEDGSEVWTNFTEPNIEM